MTPEAGSLKRMASCLSMSLLATAATAWSLPFASQTPIPACVAPGASSAGLASPSRLGAPRSPSTASSATPLRLSSLRPSGMSVPCTDAMASAT
eukprot:scaffold395_cov243-Pinguiococcus_pyrenoidosus.AAC.44